MKKRLLVVIGIGVLILLVGTALYQLRPKGLYSSRTTPNDIKKVKDVWHAQDIPSWTLVRGQELNYDLNYGGSSQLPGQTATTFAFQLQGTLQILVLSEESHAYRVWLSIKPDRIPQLQQIPEPMQASLQKTWMEGIGARMAMRGFHIEPELGQGTDPTITQFWQTLTERMQVDLPAIMQTPIWMQQETMGGGTVPARYEIDPTLLSPAMLGEKIYVQKSYDATPMPRKKLSGESLILMHPHFEGLYQLEAEAREVQEVNGENWASESSLKLFWKQQRLVEESKVASLEAHWGERRDDAESSQESSIQQAALGAVGLDELWSLMNQPGMQNSQDLYLKLKAWIYLHPDEIQRLLDRVKGLDEGDPALKMAIRALAAAGRPEAQNALVDLLDQRKSDVSLARKIITTLGLVPEPTLKAQRSLETLSQGQEDTSIRRSSRLALGIMGQRLSQNSDPDAQKRALDIEAQALQNLRQATGLAATTDALAALGNCGLSRIEDLEPWLRHPDPAIRGQAYFALRFAKPASTSDYLVAHYQPEASAEVRRQIVQAMSLRAPDNQWFKAVETLLGYAVPDEDKIVLAKTLIGTVRKHKEASLKILGQLLDQTQDPVVRESLAKYQETAKKQASF